MHYRAPEVLFRACIAQNADMKEITSSRNPLFRVWLELRESKGIKKHSAFLVAGRKLVPEVLKGHSQAVLAVLLPPKAALPAGANAIDTFRLSAELFHQLDDSGTHFPLLVVTTPEVEVADLSRPPNGAEVLCCLGDPQNVGALVRIAAAFSISRFILMTESASPFHPKAVRASSGTVLRMKFAKGPSLKALCEDKSLQNNLIVLDQGGIDLAKFSWPRSFRLLIGEEGLGVPPGLRGDQIVSIPIHPAVESLNATSAASIAIYASQL